MVVIIAVGGMAAAGTMMITPQISYFRSRRDAENIVESLRRARSQAMARGGSGNFGIIIFRGKLDTTRTSVEAYDTSLQTPFCFAEFADRDSVTDNNDRDLGEVSKPSMSSLALAVAEFEPETLTKVSLRQNIIGMHEETSLLGSSCNPLSNATIFQFDSKGRLDQGKSSLGGCIREPSSGTVRSYSFDIENPNMGYYRVRVRVTGSVEISGMNEIPDSCADRAPTVQDATGDESAF